MKPNKITLYLIALFTVGTIISSCHKEDDHDHTPSVNSPNVNIVKPSFGDSIKMGDTLKIVIDVTHDAELHDYELQIRHADNDTLIYKKTGHSHDKSLNFIDFWKNTMPPHTYCKLIFTIEDHSGNKSTKDVKFFCKMK